MGVWGDGNFERDDALNMLDGRYAQLLEDIRKTFQRKHETTLYEDTGESGIVANIDILTTLFEHYQSTPPGLALEEIAQWKQDYLDTFDRTIQEYLSAPGFAERRRKTVEATFDRLYTLLKEWFED